MKPIVLFAWVMIVSVLTMPTVFAQSAEGRITAAPRKEVTISDIQKARVAMDGPRGYYTTNYSKVEADYWEKIPSWMKEDRSKRTVRRALDIGCGYGTLLAYAAALYDAAGYCMDITEYFPAQFRKPSRLLFGKGNVELDPIPWKTRFDVIIMTEVLEHFNFQPVPTLKKIRDALAPDGVFFLSTPNQEKWGKTTKYYKRLQDLPAADRSKAVVDDHIWQYDEQELRDVLSEAGFEILKFDFSTTDNRRHFNVMAIRK